MIIDLLIRSLVPFKPLLQLFIKIYDFICKFLVKIHLSLG